jgi:pimeloyl-ACP methyl ester carboxylesterase
VAFAHFWPLTRILEIFRELQNGAPPIVEPIRKEPRTTNIEPVTGRYIYLTVLGIEYRVYFEQNGSGVPLVCQHTAASDGRLWRHLLNDPDITRGFQVIVPDLPYHGKSSPPVSVAWREEYKHEEFFWNSTSSSTPRLESPCLWAVHGRAAGGRVGDRAAG